MHPRPEFFFGLISSWQSQVVFCNLTSSLGKRRLTCSIEKGDTTMGGVLESHETDTRLGATFSLACLRKARQAS